MAIIGDQFDDCRSAVKVEDKGKSSNSDGLKTENGDENGNDWPEICGCTISVRQSEDIVTLWNKVDGDARVREQIRYVMSLA